MSEQAMSELIMRRIANPALRLAAVLLLFTAAGCMDSDEMNGMENDYTEEEAAATPVELETIYQVTLAANTVKSFKFVSIAAMSHESVMWEIDQADYDLKVESSRMDMTVMCNPEESWEACTCSDMMGGTMMDDDPDFTLIIEEQAGLDTSFNLVVMEHTGAGESETEALPLTLESAATGKLLLEESFHSFTTGTGGGDYRVSLSNVSSAEIGLEASLSHAQGAVNGSCIDSADSNDTECLYTGLTGDTEYTQKVSRAHAPPIDFPYTYQITASESSWAGL